MSWVESRDGTAFHCHWASLLLYISELNDLVRLQQKQVAAWTEDRQKVRFHSSSVQLMLDRLDFATSNFGFPRFSNLKTNAFSCKGVWRKEIKKSHS